LGGEATQGHVAPPAVIDPQVGRQQLIAFGGLQVWWISSTLRTRGLAKPLSAKGFRRSLERIFEKDQPPSE